jgi:hypothetical protein
MAKQKIQTTIIGSINIQSAKGNSKYLENILNTCDILCIQEHWLLSLEKKILENMHKDFNVSAKAVDDDDIKLNYKSLRGNGGIAVFWKKTIDNAVKIKSDGGSRIQVITINYLRFAFSVMMVECKVNWIVCRQYQVAFYSKLLKDTIPSSVVSM